MQPKLIVNPISTLQNKAHLRNQLTTKNVFIHWDKKLTTFSHAQPNHFYKPVTIIISMHLDKNLRNT